MPDPWGVSGGQGGGAAPGGGYMTDAEFDAAMNGIFGPGSWRQSGGWRSQQTEDWLRAHGAATVRPGVTSAHTLGSVREPGARDVVVAGMNPTQVAQRIRAEGLPAAQLYPEGAAGNQGAHLHVGMLAGAHDPWGVTGASGPASSTPAPDPWGVTQTQSAAAPPPPARKADLFSTAASLAGGALEGVVSFGRGLQGIASAAGADQARNDADAVREFQRTGGGRAAEWTAQERQQALTIEAQLKTGTAPVEHPRLNAAARGIGRGLTAAAQAIEPANRTGVESIAHGAGFFGPALLAGAVDPTLAAGVFAGQGYDETYREAIAKGADEETARRAATQAAYVQGTLGGLDLGGAAGAALERVGVGGLAGRMGGAAVGNAALNGSMQAGQNVVAAANYDPDRPFLQGVPEATLAGGLGGAAVHGAGEAFGGARALLRPREAPQGAAADMPETTAAQAYRDMAAQRAANATPGPHAPSDATEAPPASVTPPSEYEAHRQAEGAPAELMGQAIEDFGEWKRAAPADYSLFRAIRDLGGIRTHDAAGDRFTVGPDIDDALSGLGRARRGLAAKSKGLPPEQMAQALADRGWFGPNVDDPSLAFEAAFNAEAGGDKAYHPESTRPEIMARRADLDADMDGAGVSREDPPAVAAAKLAAYRAQALQQMGVGMDHLRRRAELAGVTVQPGMTYDELLGDVVEREAIGGEHDGWSGDHDERLIDHVLTPEEHEWLSSPERGPRGEQEPPQAPEGPGPFPPPQRGPPRGGGEPGARPGGGGEEARGVPGGPELDPWRETNPLRMVGGRMEGEPRPSPPEFPGGHGAPTEREIAAPPGSVDHWNGRVRAYRESMNPERYRAMFGVDAPPGAKTGRLVEGEPTADAARKLVIDTYRERSARMEAEAKKLARSASELDKRKARDLRNQAAKWRAIADHLALREVWDEAGLKARIAMELEHQQPHEPEILESPRRGKRAARPEARIILNRTPEGEWRGRASIDFKNAGGDAGGGGRLFPTREAALRDTLAALRSTMEHHLKFPDMVDEAKRTVKWVDAQEAALGEAPKFSREPYDAERMRLGGEEVEQQLIPGGAASAKQAAAARGETLKAKKPQREAPPGDLFAPPEPDQGDLFGFSRERAPEHPDLFAHMERLAERAPKGPFHEAAPDPRKIHFDQNHADLARLGELARSGRATPAQLSAEAGRLALEMGAYMDWSDVPIGKVERDRIAKTGVPSADEMIRAAKEYVRDFKEHPGGSLYDAEAYHGLVRRWYEAAGGERPKFSRETGQPVFYSALERVVGHNPQRQASPDQWWATLKNAPGVKKDELEWVGLEDWLKLWGKEPVPKEAVQAFVRDHGVRVEERALRAPTQPEIEARADELAKDRVESLADQMLEVGHAEDEQRAREQAREIVNSEYGQFLDQAEQELGPRPEYGDWTLPGGQDYHELLLTLPGIANPPATHWETPGVMAHVRFNTREAPDGKKVLFVEEVQSDWHQKGRDQGYQNEASLAQRAATEKAYDQALASFRDASGALEKLASERGWLPDVVHGTPWQHLGDIDRWQNARDVLDKHPEDPAVAAALSAWRAADLARRETDQKMRQTETGIANAPFKSSWPALVMKRVIAWASDHGYERVAWTTGAQQAERYALSHHVQRIYLHDNWSGGAGLPKMEGSFEHGTLTAYNAAGNRVIERHVEGEEGLREVVGRELADRLLAREARQGRVMGNIYRERSLQGLDLDVGGEGMKAFYDRNLVNITNDLIKKYGAQVGKVPVSGIREEWRTPTAEDAKIITETRVRLELAEQELARIQRESVGAPTPERLAIRAQETDARRAVREASAEYDRVREAMRADDQPGFDLTPELKTAATGGFPLFQRLASAGHVGFAGKGAHLVDDLYGVPAREVDAKTSALIDKVHAEIGRLAPHAKPKAFERLTDETYQGQGYSVMGAAYRRGLQHVIAWSLESRDPIRTARHEAVHVLKAAELIRKPEWRALEEAAIDRDWLGRYHIAERYPGVGWEMELEEAVADAFGEGQRDPAFLKALPPFAQAIFRRMRDLFTRVASMAREALGGRVTADEVMRRIETGEVGARLQRAVARPETAFSREATEPPEEPQARRTRSAINRFLGEGIDDIGRKISRAAARYMPDAVTEWGEALRMGVNPMAAGSARAMALAKDFANALREHTWEWGRMDKWLEKTFSPQERREMWEAADEESVLRQKGAEPGAGEGLNRLEPRLRATVEELQRRAGRAFSEAQELGMTKADGLPSYVPRMVIEMTAEGPRRLKGKRAGTSEGVGRNLTTTTGQLRQREHLTTEETEAAARAKFGGGAMVIRDIRTLAYATGKLEQAIAGRRLVNGIKEAGRQTGQTLVSEGSAQNPDDVFTLDHPALKVWGPKFVIDHDTGRLTTIDDPATGKPVMEAKPLYISREFEGPLRAVLSQTGGSIERALMTLKGKTMSIIMYSPLMHNMVIYGKAVPAMLSSGNPLRLFDTYARGYAIKTDPAQMREWLRGGLDPIGRRYFNQDITAMLEEPQIAPGRSWTAQILGAIADLAGKPVTAIAKLAEPGLPARGSLAGAGWGDAVKRGVDRFGNLWHNTFLWDRVADLQLGLADIMRQGFMKHGMDRETATRVAAHFANRYAGALPMEAMSRLARNTANLVFFSRSFTFTNLGAWKDAIAGLPPDIQAQIGRDKGLEALQHAQGTARGKAMSMIAIDLVAAHVSMLLASSAIWALYTWLGQPWALQVGNAADKAILDALGAHAAGPNEPGKEDRVLVGYDADGTALYARLPTGKFIEDIFGWLTDPIGEAERKFSPFMRFGYQLAANDKGFGHKLVDPYDKTPAGALRNLSRIIFGADISSLHSPDDFTGGLLGSFTPVGLIQGIAHWAGGVGDPRTAMLQTILPLFGITISKGAGGGPASGDLFRARDEHDFRVQEAMPDIRTMIRSGKVVEARAKMNELGIAPGLQNYYVRTTRNPASRLTGRELRDFRRYGSPDDKARLESDQAAALERAREESVAQGQSPY